MDVETIQLSLDDVGDSYETSLITVGVTQEQEAAMEAFFQINSWQLIKESKSENISDDGSQALTIHVTAEQEAALHAFFQINSWNVTCVKQVDTIDDDAAIDHIDDQQGEPQECDLVEHEQIQTIKTEQILDGTTVEEVSGLQMIKVTTTDTDGKPQVITVFAEGGNKELPESLLGEMTRGGGHEMPQVIIQEITLPDGMSLDHGLVIANPGLNIVKRITPRGSMRPGDKVHKCHVCGKMFKQLQSFNGHYQSHFGAKPFKCDICNKGFTLKAALVSHQTIHTGAKPFVCTLCNKGFRRKDDMMCHLRTHTGEKPYECDMCGKKFKYRNQIPKHRRAHTGEKPYECTTCNKRFTSNIHLSRHIRTHTGERPYKCVLCQKAFTQYGHLQAHTRIHTDERPFPCDVCGRRFREKKVMKRHELLHTTERKYKCDVCGRGFLRQSNLDLHAVMHVKGPKEGGLRRGRPQPKKKQADTEMRQFVASVLSNVMKVDSGMQTENYVNGIQIGEEKVSAADNLSAFVDFAVEQGNKTAKIGNITDLENAQAEVVEEQQYTLVMQDDGSGGYLISSCDGSAVSEEIVNSLPSQQVEVSTVYNNVAGSGGESTPAEKDCTYNVNVTEKVVHSEAYVSELEVGSGESEATAPSSLAQGDILPSDSTVHVVLEDPGQQNVVLSQ